MPMTEFQLASIKKRLCNPPFENLAASGDPVVLGLFQGVGELMDSLDLEGAPKDLVAHYLTAVVEIETAYADARNSAAGECISAMTALRVKFLEALAEPTP